MSEVLDILYDADLSRFTTLKTGGKGELVFVPKNLEEFSAVLKQTPVNIPVTILGLGSNALIPDVGIKGLVIILQGSGLNKLEQHADNLVNITADAGVACGQFARFAARLGLTSMEFMAGIPGTIGGALAMNAGCYNGETWDLVSSVTTITRHGEIKTRDKAEYEIAYRTAELKNKSQKIGSQEISSKEYFISVEFNLKPGDKKTSLSNIKKLLAQRNQSQPTNFPNCGSVFRNPKGDFSARLIEACGLKGVKAGHAQISEKHANFIVNLGGATTNNIVELIDLMHSKVKDKFNVSLEREVRYLGNINSE